MRFGVWQYNEKTRFERAKRRGALVASHPPDNTLLEVRKARERKALWLRVNRDASQLRHSAGISPDFPLLDPTG